ncbi:uncharacterized protein LOC144920676 [Branchiostoma floridae x Branchiostoma belcheri]
MRKWTTTTWTATNNDAVPASTASSSTATTSAGHTAPSSTTSAERTATGSTALAANRLRDIGRAEGSREFITNIDWGHRLVTHLTRGSEPRIVHVSVSSRRCGHLRGNTQDMNFMQILRRVDVG